MEKIGYKIKQLRETNNLSREYIAEQMGISDRTYSKIENNERDPTFEELESISQLFKIDTKDLLYGTPKIVFENKDSVSIQNQGTIVNHNSNEINAVYIKHLESEIEYLKSLLEKSKTIM